VNPWWTIVLPLSPLTPPATEPSGGVDPPAPLSPSSGGSAGRSDRERVGRPPCTARSVGFPPCFGGLPRQSSTLAPTGGAGGRRAPLLSGVRGGRRQGRDLGQAPGITRLGPVRWPGGAIWSFPLDLAMGAGTARSASICSLVASIRSLLSLGDTSADGRYCSGSALPLCLTKVVGAGRGGLCFSSSASQRSCYSLSCWPAVAARGAR
jgi:hypothetical protein